MLYKCNKFNLPQHVMGLKDDIAYVGILFASIGFGKIFRMIPAENVNGTVSFSIRRYSKVVLKAFD